MATAHTATLATPRTPPRSSEKKVKTKSQIATIPHTAPEGVREKYYTFLRANVFPVFLGNTFARRNMHISFGNIQLQFICT